MSRQHLRLLRVGVVFEGRILEERLIRASARVTIGQSPDCTLYHPSPDLPARLMLFERRRATWRLCTHPGVVSGRIRTDEELVSVASLPRAVSDLPLTATSRGRLELPGGVSVLFQMVKPPPPVSRLQLPASVRPALGAAILRDRGTLTAIAASVLLHLGMVAASTWLQSPPDLNRKRAHAVRGLTFDVERRVPSEEPAAQADLPEPPDEPTASDSVVAVTPPSPPAVPPPASKPSKTSQPTRAALAATQPPTPTKTRHRRRARLRNRTLLKPLTAAGLPGNGGPDTLANGHALRDAFDDTHGITRATSARDVAGFRGGPKLESQAPGGPEVALRAPGATSGRLSTGRLHRQKQRAKHERRVHLRARVLRPRGQSAPGTLVQIHRFFRKRGSAFRACYESRLKTLPSLSGKITLQVSIQDSGRVGSVRIAANTTGDSVIAACIRKKVQSWTVGQAAGHGLVRVRFPIILSRQM